MDFERIEAVFRDAHVIDVDFSVWDREIRLVVIAVEETAFPAKRLPLYEVSFEGVTTFAARFPRRGPTDPSRQWNVFGVEVIALEEGVRLLFAAEARDPELEVVCRDVRVSGLEISIVDELFPGWTRPGGTLVRPSIRELWEARRG